MRSMSVMENRNCTYINRNEDSNSYSSLCRNSIESCDFCEKVFNNRYSNLVHNAKHIIIPLLNQTVHQCDECFFCFTSQDDLTSHVVRKHPDIESVSESTERRLDPEPIWDSETEMSQSNKNPMEKMSVTVLPPDILKSLVEGETRELGGTGLKNRIVFEDQDEDIISLGANVCIDLTADRGVNGDIVYEDIIPHTPLSQRMNTMKYQAPINCEESTNNGISENWTSIHYDDLVVAGQFQCKYCGEIYTNRLRLIQHEPKHIRLKRPRPVLCPHCDWFMSGNYKSLQKHIDKKHPNTRASVKCQKICKHCGLKYYNYSRHEGNYHSFKFCTICEQKLEVDFFQQHVLTHESEGFPKLNGKNRSWDTKVVKICDMCFSFLRNKQNVQYVHMGDVNEMGVRQTCEKCGSKHFEVKLVKLVQRPKESHWNDKKKKPMSNRDRLKNIQHRLKKMTSMNKY